MRRSANEAVPKRDVLDEYTCKHVCILIFTFLYIFTKAESNDTDVKVYAWICDL